MMLTLSAFSTKMPVLRKIGFNMVSVRCTWKFQVDIMSKAYISHCTTNHLLKSSSLTNPVCLRRHAPCRTLVRPAGKTSQLRPKHAEDGVSQDFCLIYQSSMAKNNAFFVSATFVFFTFVSMVSFIAIKVLRIQIDVEKEIKVPFMELYVPELYTSACIASAMFFAPIVWYLFRSSKLSFVRIYHNKETDRFVGMVKNNWLINKKLDFSIGDVRKQQSMGIFGTNGNISISGRGFIIAAYDFTEIEYFNRMLGFTQKKTSGNSEFTKHQSVKQIEEKSKQSIEDETVKKRIQQ